VDPEAVRGRPGLDRAAEDLRAFAHAGQAASAAVELFASAGSVVAHVDSTSCSVTAIRTEARHGPACFMTFVSASCTIRYADTSTAAGRSPGSPLLS
jgi:hypothetical protein